MNYIVFDTEDDSKELLESGLSGFNKTVTQVAAMSSCGDTFHKKGANCVPMFLRWLEKREEVAVFAHNCQYDLGNLFSKCLDELDVTMVKGRFIRGRWHGKQFLDSYNLWPMSAAKLGEAFGLSKLPMNVHSKDYVMRDVQIIMRAIALVSNLCDEYGLETIPSTLGGLAVRVHQSMGEESCHDSSELSRRAMFGGRVELFKQANESDRVVYADINSLYPSVMREKFPGPLEPASELLAYGISDCTVRVPKTDLPVLPWRSEDGKIIYGYGKFRGVWTNAELFAAIKTGVKVMKLHETMGTNESVQPYQNYVTTLFAKRLDSKTDSEKLFFKLLLNNLYGRLGSSGKISRSVNLTEDNFTNGIPYGRKCLVDYQMPVEPFVNWAHAAYVTAYGRLALHGYLDAVGSAAMIYCDTDSVIFDWRKGETLPFPIGKEMGQMKIEGEHECCLTYAPKMYRVGDTWRAKGVPRRLARQFIETGEASFDLPFKMRESILFYDRDNTKQLSIWRKVSKHLSSHYDKKKLRGNRFFPLKIE